MKKYLVIACLFVAALSLGGCESKNQNTQISATVDKEGILTMKSGDVYLLSTDEGIINITSNKVNLDEYLKKRIKVRGMFSGDTLYVDTTLIP